MNVCVCMGLSVCTICVYVDLHTHIVITCIYFKVLSKRIRTTDNKCYMSNTQILVSDTIPHETGTSALQKNGWFQDWGTDQPGAAYNRKRNNSNKQRDL